MDIGHGGNEFGITTNLIVHHSIMDISNQTTEHICILGIGDESLNLPSPCQ